MLSKLWSWDQRWHALGAGEEGRPQAGPSVHGPLHLGPQVTARACFRRRERASHLSAG